MKKKEKMIYRPRILTEGMFDLIKLVEEGRNLPENPIEFVRRKRRPDFGSAEAAGRYGERVVEEIIRSLIDEGHITCYIKSKPWSVLDREGIDFLINPTPERYPDVSGVKIDAAFNREVLERKEAKLVAWMQRNGLTDNLGTYFCRNLYLILSAEDNPRETLILWLEKMEEFWEEQNRGSW